MAETQPVTVTITAYIQGLLDGLKKSVGAVKESSDEMKGHLEGLGAVIDKLKTPFIALAGVVAGGVIFKDVIDETVKWNSEVSKLSKTIGTSTETASVLAVALEHISIPTEVYTAAVARMSRQLATGAKGFEALGIEVYTSDGHLKKAQDLMMESLDVIRGFTAGLDRNAAGVTIFGKGWQELAPLLRLTTDGMKEAEERAKRLHLIVGPEGAAMTRQYKQTLAELHDVSKSFKVQIGNELLPLLVKLGSWLAEEGSRAADAFGFVLKGIIQVVVLLVAVFQTFFAVLQSFLVTIVETMRFVGNTLAKVVKGDIKGAMDEAKKYATEVKNLWVMEGKSITDAWQGMVDKSKELWSHALPKPGGAASEPEGDTFQVPEKEGKDTELQHQTKVLKAMEEAERKKQELKDHIAQQNERIQQHLDRAEDKRIEERKKKIEGFVRGAGQAVMGVFRAIIDGSKSAEEIIVSLVKSIADAIVSSFVKMAEEFIIAQLSGKAAAKAASTSTTAGHTAEAIAGAYASQAFIPFVGPELGAAAALEAEAFLLGATAPMLMAARGYDIPSGVNPIVQAHQREMILPEEHADTIRNLRDGGGDTTFQINFNGPVDRVWWNSHEDEIIDTLRKARRKGKRT